MTLLADMAQAWFDYSEKNFMCLYLLVFFYYKNYVYQFWEEVGMIGFS